MIKYCYSGTQILIISMCISFSCSISHKQMPPCHIVLEDTENSYYCGCDLLTLDCSWIACQLLLVVTFCMVPISNWHTSIPRCGYPTTKDANSFIMKMTISRTHINHKIGNKWQQKQEHNANNKHYSNKKKPCGKAITNWYLSLFQPLFWIEP